VLNVVVYYQSVIAFLVVQFAHRLCSACKELPLGDVTCVVNDWSRRQIWNFFAFKLIEYFVEANQKAGFLHGQFSCKLIRRDNELGYLDCNLPFGCERAYDFLYGIRRVRFLSCIAVIHLLHNALDSRFCQLGTSWIHVPPLRAFHCLVVWVERRYLVVLRGFGFHILQVQGLVRAMKLWTVMNTWFAGSFLRKQRRRRFVWHIFW